MSDIMDKSQRDAIGQPPYIHVSTMKNGIVGISSCFYSTEQIYAYIKFLGKAGISR